MTMLRMNLTHKTFLFFLTMLFFEANIMAFEEPQYSVTSKTGKIEIRQYQAFLVAETAVSGSRESAGSNGFKILASYIFGNNKGDNNIAMTAPVIQVEEPTFSVTQPSDNTNSKDPKNQSWTIQFMMPAQYTLESLPKPRDSRVKFKTIPPRKMASITYSGRWTESNYLEHLDILNQEIQKAGIKTKGTALWARYNSPFTPWFLRKNEILIEID
ncbi:heme-binding protein [bacterium]|nr:heme-binding protein [bacterium]